MLLIKNMEVERYLKYLMLSKNPKQLVIFFKKNCNSFLTNCGIFLSNYVELRFYSVEKKK